MSQPPDPRRDYLTRLGKTYALAQNLAAKAVTDWAIECNSYERGDHLKALYDVLVENQRDPAGPVQAALAHDVRLSDGLGELWSVVEDASYLYGLAIGIALTRAGRS